ncbi:MAG: formylglycine-generating enzyme family protein [Prosthecobacter sp.]|uniref:formylglycine-generating enzyme family protein n=1 Tax=Prosthecobacter sp. TaxID=1965333 RepID=UPI0038FDA5D1
MKFCTTEVTYDQYQAYARETPGTDSSWEKASGKGSHPVVYVSFDDAMAFCEWLSRKEGKNYRLPTDHEWSCAVGIGDQEDSRATPKAKDGKIVDVYPWGISFPPPSNAGNYNLPEDGYERTAPVGSYRPNRYGIYDLGGNVSEWCPDPYEPSFTGRVLRGGSWYSGPSSLLSSYRYDRGPGNRDVSIGFRCVLVVGSGG